MCTLTYIPLSKDSAIITSNRDESFLRERALPPAIYELNNIKVAYPKDPLAGGTWIATAENGVTANLLNGAFAPHEPSPPYRKSRGLILLDVFNFHSIIEFCNKINLEQIEPFTLVIFSSENIIELKWNGSKKFIKEYDLNIPILWASEQLYTEENIVNRKRWFENFLQKNELNQKNILSFHENAGEGDIENNLKIKRSNSLSTLSITSIKITPVKHEIYYKDLFTNEEFNLKIR